MDAVSILSEPNGFCRAIEGELVALMTLMARGLLVSFAFIYEWMRLCWQLVHKRYIDDPPLLGVGVACQPSPNDPRKRISFALPAKPLDCIRVVGNDCESLSGHNWLLEHRWNNDKRTCSYPAHFPALTDDYVCGYGFRFGYDRPSLIWPSSNPHMG